MFHVEQANGRSSLLEKCLDEIGVHLEADQLDKFRVYLQELQAWNRSVNLTAITVDEEIVIKHFVDSLAVLKVETIKPGASLLDVGTGAGFPGIPLKIARSDLRITLVEPVQKKVSFLYWIVGLLHLENVKIFYGTLEQFIAGGEAGYAFDYITTRALKYDLILRRGARLLAGGGRAIIYLSHPIDVEHVKGWSIVTQHGFDLPGGLGRRFLSILCVSQERTV